MTLDLRLGVDLGMAETVGVVLNAQGQVVAKAGRPTTTSVTTGFEAALDDLLEDPFVAADHITQVMVGTTQVTDALVECRGLKRVAVIRLGAPLTTSVPPLFGWPHPLRSTVLGAAAVVRGGREFDGRPIASLDTDSVKRFVTAYGPDVDSFAVTGVFSPFSAEDELAVESLIHTTLGPVTTSLSHRVGGLGLIERENATVLNAALYGVLDGLAACLSGSLATRGIEAELYFTTNTGTLMESGSALGNPGHTIGSGPAAALRGAVHLTGLLDAFVVEVGAKATTLGALVNGYPRRATQGAEIGGVRANLPMPDLRSLEFGAHSFAQSRKGTAQSPNAAGSDGSAKTVAAAHDVLTQAIDEMKVSSDAVPVIALGVGGAFVPQSLPGIASVLHPEHHETARAIGSAMASVSGEAEEIALLEGDHRERALARASARARTNAIAAGGDPAAVQIVDHDETPLDYLAPAVRIRIKAIAPLWSR